MKIESSAPSNIALIKYMGKVEGSGNRPTNASLSYTLDYLRTFVRLEKNEIGRDTWSPWSDHPQAKFNLELSEAGQKKFLKFFQVLKDHFKISGHYHVKSINNFPSDAGLASSASSFAALSLVAAKLASLQISHENLLELSKLSRLGSGSSCRSLFSPWALWRQDGAEPVRLPQQKFHHFVLLIEKSKKEVSSSEAHKIVATSPLFQKDRNGLGRPARAEKRLDELLNSLEKNDWYKSYQICWDEFIDMHELFHTSTPKFKYMNERSDQALKSAQELWVHDHMGPLITMDAGPNVHFLFREEDFDLATKWKGFYLNQGYELLDSWTGNLR